MARNHARNRRIKCIRTITLSILAACIGIAVSGCQTQPSRNVLAEQERLRAFEPKPHKHLSPEETALYDKLVAEYRQLVAGVYSDYHGINVQMYGFGVYATHPLFTGYEFSAGPLTPAVQQWILANSTDLRKADIRFVGIIGSAGWPTIDVPPSE